MTWLSDVSTTLARPAPSRKMVRMMNRLSNPGPDNPMPTVALEVGVTSGRSVFAFFRSGFLECQERLFEEGLVALIWIWGVGWTGKLFDKVQQALSPRRLDTAIGWTVENGTVGLAPLESHVFNSAAARKILAVKGVKLVFSVLSSVGLVAFAVPWLNQKKTAWIIKNFYAKKPNGHKSQKPQTVRSFRPPASFETPRGFQPFSPQAFSPQSSTQQHDTPSPKRQGMPLRFGGFGDGLLNKVGHWVQDTDFGGLFAVDTGIIGGRTISAARRSPYESIEVALRDLPSYYFYFFAVPHVMKLGNSLMNKLFKADIQLEPMAAEVLNREILKRLETHPQTSGGDSLSHAQLKRLLHGLDWQDLPLSDAMRKVLYEDLSASLRAAPHPAFKTLLKKELAAYFLDTQRFDAMLSTLEKHLPPPTEPVTVQHLESLLARIGQQADDSVRALSALELGDLQIAVKQAFRHTVGAPLSRVLESLPLRQLMNQVGEAERTAMEGRIAAMARRDSMSLLNDTVRRILVLAGATLGENHPALPPAEDLATWIEKANSRTTSFAELLRDEARELQETLLLSAKTLPEPVQTCLNKYPNMTRETAVPFLKELSAFIKELPRGGQNTLNTLLAREGFEQKLAQGLETLLAELPEGGVNTLAREYGERARTFLADETTGRLISLHKGALSPGLVEKLDEMLLGGLARDRGMILQSLKTMGVLVEESKLYQNMHKYEAVQKQMAQYLETFLKRLETGVEKLTRAECGRELASYFSLSRNVRYGFNFLGIAFGIFGLSYLIPKVQYYFTAKLTGRNQHPGIAEALKHQQTEDQTADQAEEVSGTPALWSGPPLNRNHFPMFRNV